MYTERQLELAADHVVVEHGTMPAAELYFELKVGSRNHGEIDLDALTGAKPQPAFASTESYLHYRVGDAVTSRNIHAAIYDSLRLLKDL